jgi:hypothetical protein
MLLILSSTILREKNMTTKNYNTISELEERINNVRYRNAFIVRTLDGTTFTADDYRVEWTDYPRTHAHELQFCNIDFSITTDGRKRHIATVPFWSLELIF